MVEEKKVAFVHTTPATIKMAETFMEKILPQTEYVHLYDGNVKAENFKSPIGITPKKNLLRYANFADQFERENCDLIVSCCSLMPIAVDYAKEVVSIPFLQLDAIILDKVVENYTKIGVINTTDYTVPYVKEGLEIRAEKHNKDIELTFSVNSSALDLFNAGEYEKHDEIVLEAVKKLTEKDVECVLMGQIPFAMMDEKLKKLELKVPLLYAGEDAFIRIKEILEE